MKNILLLFFIVMLCGCVKAGEFSSERHAQYDFGKPNCEKNPEKCYKGIPW